LLYSWLKCTAVIGSNHVKWYKINFTTDYPQLTLSFIDQGGQKIRFIDYPGQ